MRGSTTFHRNQEHEKGSFVPFRVVVQSNKHTGGYRTARLDQTMARGRDGRGRGQVSASIALMVREGTGMEPWSLERIARDLAEQAELPPTPESVPISTPLQSLAHVASCPTRVSTGSALETRVSLAGGTHSVLALAIGLATEPPSPRSRSILRLCSAGGCSPSTRYNPPPSPPISVKARTIHRPVEGRDLDGECRSTQEGRW